MAKNSWFAVKMRIMFTVGGVGRSIDIGQLSTDISADYLDRLTVRTSIGRYICGV